MTRPIIRTRASGLADVLLPVGPAGAPAATRPSTRPADGDTRPAPPSADGDTRPAPPRPGRTVTVGFVVEDPAISPRTRPGSSTPPRSWIAYVFPPPPHGSTFRPSLLRDAHLAPARFRTRKGAAAAVAAAYRLRAGVAGRG